MVTICYSKNIYFIYNIQYFKYVTKIVSREKHFHNKRIINFQKCNKSNHQNYCKPHLLSVSVTCCWSEILCCKTNYCLLSSNYSSKGILNFKIRVTHWIFLYLLLTSNCQFQGNWEIFTFDKLLLNNHKSSFNKTNLNFYYVWERIFNSKNFFTEYWCKHSTGEQNMCLYTHIHKQ